MISHDPLACDGLARLTLLTVNDSAPYQKLRFDLILNFFGTKRWDLISFIASALEKWSGISKKACGNNDKVYLRNRLMNMTD